MHFVLLATHSAEVCPTSNSKVRDMLTQTAPEIPNIAEKAGVNIPLQAAEHYYLITDRIPDLPKDMPVLEDLSSAARSVVTELGSAVVSIGTDGRGSGLVIAAGKVLTNAHNLRDRTTLVTFADGRAEQGSVAGADQDGDLVVLDVDTGSTPPAAWAEEMPTEGDVVFALSRGGHRTRRIIAVGSTHRNPMPHRRMASVIGSALPTR